MKIFTTFFFMVIIFSGTVEAQEVATFTDITANGGVSVDSNGDIIVSHFGPLPFVTGQEGRNIYKITTEGEVSILAEDVVLVGTGNSIDSEGNIYQGSFLQNKVIKLDDEGNVIDNNFAAANGAVGVLAIENDTILVCSCSSNSVFKIAQDGSSSIFVSGGSFNCPNGITKDDDGNVYVSNFSDGRVIKIESNGTASLLGNTMSSGGHIAFRSLDQKLYLTSYNNHRLFTMTLDGEIAEFAGTGAPGAMDNMDPLQATFAKPNGLAFSANDCILYVTQDQNIMRQIIFTDGECILSVHEYIPVNQYFEVYPNPVTESFLIRNSSTYSIKSVTLSDITGKVLKNWSASDSELYTLPDFITPGMYTLRIKTNASEKESMKKILVH